MVRKDIALFQEIWEQTNEEQREASFLNIRRYVQCHENINMGWINLCSSVPQVLDASISLPHKVLLTLDKVVKQRCVSLFSA